MTVKSRKFTKGIRLKATDDAATLDGEIRNDKDEKRLKVHLEESSGTDSNSQPYTDPAGEREIVTSDQTQTLTKKIIDGNENTLINIDASSLGDLVTDLNQPVDNTQVAGAQAIKDYVGNTAAASSSDLIYHMSDKETHGVSGKIVGTTDAQALENKTIDSASNTITVDADSASVSNLETDNFKAGVVDTDGTLAADSDTKIPSQKAVKAYVDSATGGIVSDASGVTYTQDEGTDWQTPHTHVDSSLDELASRAKGVESDFNDHLYGTDPKHESELISYDNTVSTLTSTNVKDAIDELKGLAGSGSSAADTSYDPSSSTLTDVDVQAAVDALDVKIEANDVESYRTYYVDHQSGIDTNKGSLIKPFKTIQAAVDQVKTHQAGSTNAYCINVQFGDYTEDLDLANLYNTMIIGKGIADTQNTVINGTVDFTDSENVKLKNFRIKQAAPNTGPTIIFGKNSPTHPNVVSCGRHYIQECVIENDAAGQDAIELQDNVTAWIQFRECTIEGHIDLQPMTVGGSSLTLIECQSDSAPITCNLGQVFAAVDCYSMGYINHLGGIVYLKDIHSLERDGSGKCVESTAAFSAASLVYMEDISTYNLLTNDYGIIEVQACGYVINGCARDPSVDVLTGLRLDRSYRSEDIAYGASDVKTAIDELKSTPNNNVAALDIDWSESGVYYKDLAIDSSFTFSNDSDGQVIRVIINNTDTNPHTMTFPAGVKKSSSFSGIISASAESVFTVIKSNGKLYITEDKDLS